MIAAGAGAAFVVGRRTMPEWLVVEGRDDELLIAPAADGLAYVRG